MDETAYILRLAYKVEEGRERETEKEREVGESRVSQAEENWQCSY
jgi:hypothetical protein